MSVGPEFIVKLGEEGAEKLRGKMLATETVADQLARSMVRLEQSAALKAAQAGSAKYQEALAKLHPEVEKTSTAAASAGTSTMALAGGMITAANQAVQLAQQIAAAAGAVWEFAKAGAQAADVEQAFYALGGSAAGLNDLREALAGTVDDTSLQKMSNTARALGVDMSRLPDLAKIAGKASLALGEDVTFMFESIVKGTARESALILDNLGVKIKDSAGQLAAEYKRMGVAAATASADQRAAAFATVVANNAAALSSLDYANSQGAAYAQVKTAIDNQVSAIQVATSEWLVSSGVMDTVTGIVSDLGGYFNENKEAIVNLVEGGLKVMAVSVGVVVKPLGIMLDLLLKAEPLLSPIGSALEFVAGKTNWLAEAAIYAAKELGEENDAGDMVAKWAPKAAAEVTALKDEQDALAEATRKATEQMERQAGDAFDKARLASGGYGTLVADALIGMDAFTLAQYHAADGVDANIAALSGAQDTLFSLASRARAEAESRGDDMTKWDVTKNTKGLYEGAAGAIKYAEAQDKLAAAIGILYDQQDTEAAIAKKVEKGTREEGHAFAYLSDVLGTQWTLWGMELERQEQAAGAAKRAAAMQWSLRDAITATGVSMRANLRTKQFDELAEAVDRSKRETADWAAQMEQAGAGIDVAAGALRGIDGTSGGIQATALALDGLGAAVGKGDIQAGFAALSAGAGDWMGSEAVVMAFNGMVAAARAVAYAFTPGMEWAAIGQGIASGMFFAAAAFGGEGGSAAAAKPTIASSSVGGGSSSSGSSSSGSSSASRSGSASKTRRETTIVQLMVDGRELGAAAISGANQGFGSSSGVRLNSSLVRKAGRSWR